MFRACSGRVVFASFKKKKILGVFWACSGCVLGLVRQVENNKRITGMALIGIFIFQKMWGVFWAWSGCVGFASFFGACCFCFIFEKKKSGACSGRVVFALIF